MRYADFSAKPAEAEVEVDNEPTEITTGSVMGDPFPHDEGAAGLMHPHPTTAELPAVLDAARRPPVIAHCEECGAANDLTEDVHVCAHCCAPLHK